MKKVSIINSGSAFRGLIGTATEHYRSGMVKVVFDVPRYGFTYSLFFAHELEHIA